MPLFICWESKRLGIHSVIPTSKTLILSSTILVKSPRVQTSIGSLSPSENAQTKFQSELAWKMRSNYSVFINNIELTPVKYFHNFNTSKMFKNRMPNIFHRRNWFSNATSYLMLTICCVHFYFNICQWHFLQPYDFIWKTNIICDFSSASSLFVSAFSLKNPLESNAKINHFFYKYNFSCNFC